MEKILNLVIVDYTNSFETESHVHSFRYPEGMFQPEKTLRNAVKEFISSGTPESKNALEHANGYYNWGDAMSTVPDSLFKKHGIMRIHQDAMDITVEHDEVLCGGLPEKSEEDGDSFSIYQLKPGDELRYIRFVGYDQLIAEGRSVEAKNYVHVYTGILSDDMTLDGIYHEFNVSHPADYEGRSLSISDVIVLRRGGKATPYYVDGPFDGYRELQEFNWNGKFWLEDSPAAPVYPKDTL